MSGYHVTLSIFPESAEELTRSLEAVARTSAGLVLDGIMNTISTATMDDDEGD